MIINWTAFSGIATGIAAIATAVAAIATAWMACMTRRSLQQAEKHHQNSFRPICILENHCGPDDPYRRDCYLTVKCSDENNLLISVQLKLKNVGSGSALRVRMILLFPNNDPESGYFVELAPLPVNGEYGDQQTPIQFRLSKQNYTDRKFDFRLPDSETEVRPIDSPWEIVLEYEDVFGNKFHTVHTRDALHPWTKVGIGRLNLPASIRIELDRQNQLEPLPRMNSEMLSQCWKSASTGTTS